MSSVSRSLWMASWGEGPPLDRCWCLDLLPDDEPELELPLKNFVILLISAGSSSDGKSEAALDGGMRTPSCCYDCQVFPGRVNGRRVVFPARLAFVVDNSPFSTPFRGSVTCVSSSWHDPAHFTCYKRNIRANILLFILKYFLLSCGLKVDKGLVINVPPRK